MLAAALMVGCGGTPHSGNPAIDVPTPDPEWDAVFARTSGWNGGDIAHSIDLRDGRTLWFFGDSIFGPVVDGRRVGDESRMLRAGVAWHATPTGAAHAAPASDSITFAAPQTFDDVPIAAWASPPPDLFPSGTWYWLMNDAVRVHEPHDRLVLFTTAIGPSGNPDGMWNFRRVGGAILTIDNPVDPPDHWRAPHIINPLVTASPAFNEPPREGDNCAVAIVEFPVGSHRYAIFGMHESVDGSKRLNTAMASAADLDNPHAWDRSMSPALTTVFSDAPRVQQAPTTADEFTVQVVRIHTRDTLVLITSGPFLSRSIIAYSALRPEGPWSQGKVIYEVPNVREGVIVYAAKGHAHLSRPGELLVSYATNADLGKVFNDASLYRPRFVRIPIALLPEPPKN